MNDKMKDHEIFIHFPNFVGNECAVHAMIPPRRLETFEKPRALMILAAVSLLLPLLQ